MPVSCSDRIASDKNVKLTWNRIAQIQEELGLDDFKLSEFMGASVESFQKARSQATPPNLHELTTLCDRLGLSFAHFLTRTIDYQVLKKKFIGQTPTLPERYTANAFGNVMSFRAILQYLALTRPINVSNWLLAELQVDLRLLQDPKTRVNIKLYEDATEKMSKLGFSLSDFEEIGLFVTWEHMKQLDLQTEIRKYAECGPIERSLLVSLSVMDQNHTYKIEKITDDTAWVSARPTSYLQEVLKRKVVGNIFTSTFKGGFFSEVPAVIGEKIRFKTTLTKSIHSGDLACLYEIKIA